MSAQVVIHSVAGEAMKPGNQGRSGASVGVCLSALGRQSIDCKKRCRAQKTANSRTYYDRSNSGRADNNTSEAFHWLIASARTVAERLPKVHSPKGPIQFVTSGISESVRRRNPPATLQHRPKHLRSVQRVG